MSSGYQPTLPLLSPPPQSLHPTEVMKIVETLLRLIQLTFVTIILALSGALLQQQYRGGTPTRLNYSMFCAVLAALSLFYLIPSLFISSIRHPIAVLVLDLLNTVFFVCAGIALASELHGSRCNDWRFLQTNGLTDGGRYGASMRHRCREANALTAFVWFASATFFFSTAFVAYDTKKNRDEKTLHREQPDMRGVNARA